MYICPICTIIEAFAHTEEKFMKFEEFGLPKLNYFEHSETQRKWTQFNDQNIQLPSPHVFREDVRLILK